MSARVAEHPITADELRRLATGVETYILMGLTYDTHTTAARLRALAAVLERERYDPTEHRRFSGCTHALHETCDKCHCPTCGQPVVVMRGTHDGATSFYMPLHAVLADRRSARAAGDE